MAEAAQARTRVERRKGLAMDWWTGRRTPRTRLQRAAAELARRLSRWSAPSARWRSQMRGFARSFLRRARDRYDDAYARARKWARLAVARGSAEWRRLLGWLDAQRRRRLPRVEPVGGNRFAKTRTREARWRHGRVSPNGTVRLTWHYGLYTPSGLRDDERAPLVVVLHGCMQRALRFAHASGWTALADAARVRLLCPEQRRLANHHGCWNWFHPAAQNGEGEVGVIMAMIDDVADLVGVDGDAVAAAGVSAGGALSTLLAFHRAQRFRAVISVAAPTLSDGPRPARGREAGALDADAPGCAPLAIIHGTADTIVHPRCADDIQERALDLLRSAGRHAEARPGVATHGRATVTDFRVQGRLLVRRIELAGQGHAWTGGPGGHHYCEPSGPPLTAFCHEFVRDVGVLA